MVMIFTSDWLAANNSAAHDCNNKNEEIISIVFDIWILPKPKPKPKPNKIFITRFIIGTN